MFLACSSKGNIKTKNFLNHTKKCTIFYLYNVSIKFILKKIQVEDNALIGAKCVLLPGTHLEKGAKLSAHSYTNFNDILKENSIYLGHPAKLKEV